MIAHELFSDEAIATRTGTRAGRARAESRRRKTLARRYRSVRVVVLSVACVTLIFVAYVGLLERITQMNYDRTVLAEKRDVLLAETGRLENELAQLESRDRLAGFAHRLAMHDPTDFAVATLVTSPAPQAPPQGLALIAGWLK